MLSDFSALFAWVVEVFSLEFTIYGFTFSLWQVFLFDAAAGILAWFLGRLFLDD